MSRILSRPMFRKGGSAGEGITSGLAPRQGYNTNQNNLVQANDLSKVDLRNMNMQQIKDLSERMSFQAPPMAPDRSLRDFKIDFGLDLVSRSPGGNIFQTAGLAAKEPFNRFKASKAAYDQAAQNRAINKYRSESDMFTTLLGAQSDILGSEGGSKSYRDLEIAKELENIIPQIYELEAKQKAGTITDGEIIQLDVLKTQKNNFTKSNPITEGAIDIFVKSSKGSTIFMEIAEELLNNDKGVGKYKGESDPQLIRDTIEEIKKILGAFSGGGRAGYANGELVEEQFTETETMAPGPQVMNDNPISYEQLRARLPAEITDDIVELMANSAEALEDFAMISSQQDVDLFNQKYSVNLVLPSGA
jgi:hypothetical protein